MPRVSGGATGAGTSVLRAALRSGGVDAVYGEAMEGLTVTPVASAELAALLARAHRRVHGRVCGRPSPGGR